MVIHMGDSSTSGWNSNTVYKGNKDRSAPFFTYKTYAQLVEEQSEVISLNAGVPGYSSLQGRKYLEQLLKQVAVHGIDVSWVTFYFGNNDATYNNHEDKVRLERKKPTPQHDGSRVSLGDYHRHLRDMIETTRDYGAEPMVIMPLVHYDWEPGIRSIHYRTEFEEALGKLERDVWQDVQRAIEEFRAGNYERALELDRTLPRIKPPYQQALRDIAHEMDVPIIDVQAAIPRTDNEAYFADYCHPLEPANQMIADAFFAITGIEKGQRKERKDSSTPLRYRIFEGGIHVLGHFFRHRKDIQQQQPDSNIYTLS